MILIFQNEYTQKRARLTVREAIIIILMNEDPGRTLW